MAMDEETKKAVIDAANAVRKLAEAATELVYRIRKDRKRLVAVHASILAGDQPEQTNSKAARIEDAL